VQIILIQNSYQCECSLTLCSACRPNHPKTSVFKFIIVILLPRDAMPQYVVCLSVHPSVTFRYRDHLRWNTLKLISRLNSLRHLLTFTPTWAIWSNGNTPKLGWNRVGSGAQKTCNISEAVQDRTKVTMSD